jgi:uncharacterized protein involved in response to NO
MTTSAERMRAWRGPAILSFGFRPFFLAGAAWAALSMALWLGMLTGALSLPTHLDPVSWHAHEFLFGYLGAVAAGFLLTAVPNWTGRLPVVGWPLAGLAGLWLAGRVAMAVSGAMPPALAAAIDLAFPLAMTVLLLREVVAGGNWHNLPVVGILALLLVGNAAFHWQAWEDGYAARGPGLRLGLAAAVMLIALIGGRIVPSFTRNWLVRAGHSARPAPPMGRFDKAALAVLLGALLLWLGWPMAPATGAALLLAGAMHLARLARWSGGHTGAEPLVWVLHVGYAFVPAGALALGAAVLWPGLLAPAAAQHLWMAGAIGTMTLAVMTRATLGHTGQELRAGPGTVAIYLGVIAATLLRFASGWMPAWNMPIYWLVGALWLGAFAGFCVGYGAALVQRRKAG